MERAELDGVALEYEVTGSGEPVVLIHGAFIADSFRPLLSEASLAHPYRMILYRRRGYAGSSRTPGPVSVERQAADCRALLAHLSIERTHVVGHSYGGSVALQLALDFPDAVQSLTLLEPALFVGSTGEGYRRSLIQGQQRFREVGAEVSVDEFFALRFGERYHSWLENALPGAVAQARADAGTWFELEMPTLLSWCFGEAEARPLAQPVLSVLGGDSDALWRRFGETHESLLQWLPHAEGFILLGTTHFMQVEDPRGTAAVIAGFCGRHPIDR